MSDHNNVNDNENVVLTSNYNVNDSKYERSRRVETIADQLLDKLGLDINSRKFMCKIAWRLPEVSIWNNLEKAAKGKNRVGLFIYLCKRDMVD